MENARDNNATSQIKVGLRAAQGRIPAYIYPNGYFNELFRRMAAIKQKNPTITGENANGVARGELDAELLAKKDQKNLF